MEALFHLKFAKKSKRKSKKKAEGQHEDIPERPKSMTQEKFNLEETDSLGTLDKDQSKERFAVMHDDGRSIYGVA